MFSLTREVQRAVDWERFSAEIETTGLLLDYDRCVLVPMVRELNGRFARPSR
ncbi:hypothetical protein AB0C33_46735 [Nonomuraea sp. NPDC048881]|uniref:hypothetical protein n=1 Tax=Nonomuraea sp. NPDC048881 TaxID=3155030 RepID=UPI0033DD1870